MRLAEVLTQEEINALLSQFAAPDEESAAPAGATPEGRSYRLYDFKRPNRFSREQLRTIHMLHETFARRLSTTLSAHLRTPVKVILGEYSRRYTMSTEFAEGAGGHTVHPEPLEGQAAIEFSPYIIFIMIDRLMGGRDACAGALGN